MIGFKNLGVAPPPIDPPYPGWGRHLIKIVEAAIRAASQQMLAERSFMELHSADENKLTNWLQGLLWRLLEEGNAVPGFSYAAFDKPMRGAEVENHDGTKISKKPDITFYRHGAPGGVADGRHDGWFCECKILDATHSLNDYLFLGLMRFIEGTYAWAMPEAQMIGYVRYPASAGYDPAIALSTYLNSTNLSNGITYASATCMLASMQESTGVFATTHARQFSLRSGSNPGPIAVRHLWLQLE